MTEKMTKVANPPSKNRHNSLLTLGAVHILRKHILGSLNTLGGVVSTW